MPLYEYECEACSSRFEKIQKFSDPLEDTCPKCGGHVHKLMSSPAIQFKGTGWYITDYAKSGSSKESKETKGTKESKDSADSSKESSKDSSSKTESTKTESTTTPKAD